MKSISLIIAALFLTAYAFEVEPLDDAPLPNSAPETPDANVTLAANETLPIAITNSSVISNESIANVSDTGSSVGPILATPESSIVSSSASSLAPESTVAASSASPLVANESANGTISSEPVNAAAASSAGGSSNSSSNASSAASSSPQPSSTTAAVVSLVPIPAGFRPQQNVPSLPSLVTPDSSSIFVAKGVYVKTSAAEKPCKQNQDCYGSREPDEWCPLPDQTKYGDKGCFCDHVRFVCTIQRQTDRGEEYSDCADKSVSACAGLKPVVRIQQQSKSKSKSKLRRVH